jgi:hypothetical protein
MTTLCYRRKKVLPPGMGISEAPVSLFMSLLFTVVLTVNVFDDSAQIGFRCHHRMKHTETTKSILLFAQNQRPLFFNGEIFHKQMPKKTVLCSSYLLTNYDSIQKV